MQDPEKGYGRSRKRNMSLYYITLAVIVIIIFSILAVTVFFNVETVIVTGSSIYTAEEIVAASGINGGDNMIRKNMGKAEKRITEDLIYIETAEITRRFPSSLEISVTPCQETACMDNYDNGYRIVSRTGKILASSASPGSGLPIFYGTEPAEGLTEGMKFVSADENKTEVIYELMERANSEFGSKITDYNVSDRLNISCTYEGRIEIDLGVIADIDYKYRLAENILSTKISPDAEGRLRMLENSAQFLSKSDLEQIEQTVEFNMETSVSQEETAADPASESSSDAVTDASETTKLNFE